MAITPARERVRKSRERKRRGVIHVDFIASPRLSRFTVRASAGGSAASAGSGGLGRSTHLGCARGLAAEHHITGSLKGVVLERNHLTRTNRCPQSEFEDYFAELTVKLEALEALLAASDFAKHFEDLKLQIKVLY
jgi:hypothetical protein